jgi:hypothetical protein
MKLKHETKTFLWDGRLIEPGTVFNVPGEVAQALIRDEGCVKVEEPTGPPVNVKPDGPPEVITDEIPHERPDDQPEKAVHVGGGWWEYAGERYRKKDLPPKAR